MAEKSEKYLQYAAPQKNDVFLGAVFSTAYLPPVSWFASMINSKMILLEANEHFIKQSYRNRCHIAGANGMETLSIPIESNSGKKYAIRDVRLSDHGNWQQAHWRALQSAYNSSPFFEYYADDFAPFYEKKCSFLWDYNWELLTLIFELLDMQPEIQFTENYRLEYNDKADFREIIHPKKESVTAAKTYYQVFAPKLGFKADLSIVDLLFNMGNEAILTLKR